MSISAPPRPGGQTATPRGKQGVLPAVVVSLVAVLVLCVLAVALLVRGESSGPGVQGSGVAATQSRVLASFSSVDLVGSGNVKVVVGRRESVVVHADSNLLRNVTTRVVSGTLIVGSTGTFSTKSPMFVEVRVPSLASVTLTGSGQISVTGIHEPWLSLALPGSGSVYASGTVTQLNVTLSGSGLAQLGNLLARNVHAVVAGSGLIRVTATASLNAAVSGSGAIIYDGNPRVARSITGSGAVTPG